MGFSLVEIVVQVIHKNADSFCIHGEPSSASRGILEKENHFPSLTNSVNKVDGGFYLYLIHVIHGQPIWGRSDSGHRRQPLICRQEGELLSRCPW
jgi:hypothetical protein